MLSVVCRAVPGILPAGFFSRDFTGFGTIPRSREETKVPLPRKPILCKL